MRAALLGLAASIAAVSLTTSPAQAQALAGAGFTAGPAFGAAGPRITTLPSTPSFNRDFGVYDGGDGRDRRHRRRHRDLGDSVFIGGWGYSQLEPTFGPTQGNDWWHERPNRSYPRWVRSNDACERVWQGGGTWRCEW